MSRIRWSLVGSLALVGPLFGGLTIFAIIQGWEPIVAAILLLGIGMACALLIRRHPVRNALVAGFLAGLLAIWTQVAFLDAYFAANPAYRQIEIPFGLAPRSWTVLFAPLGAVAAALVAAIGAALTRIVARGFGEGPPANE